MTVSVAVSRFSSDLAVRMEPMLRLDTEEAPAEPTDGPTLPDVEGAVPEDVQDSALKNIESLGPIFGVSLNIAIGVLSGVLFTAVVALVVRIVMRRRKRMLSHLKILLRSEEHTSELQSRGHLVCRLLLEKKNQYHTM